MWWAVQRSLNEYELPKWNASWIRVSDWAKDSVFPSSWASQRERKVEPSLVPHLASFGWVVEG